MSDVKKPVDLVAIRARMAIKSPCHSASDFTKRLEDQDRLIEVDAPDMADEIERLRAMLTKVVDDTGTVMLKSLYREACALLPPS